MMHFSKWISKAAILAVVAVTSLALLSSDVYSDEKRPKVGEKAADFELSSLAGETIRLSDLVAEGPVVLVVLRGYPGYQCPLCNKQVSDFLQQSKKFKELGAQVVFVYPGPSSKLSDRAQEFLGEKNVPDDFHLLIDPDYTFTNQYGLRWDAPRETAYPATFVIQKNSTITFMKISTSHGGRTNAKEILKVLTAKNESLSTATVTDVFSRVRQHEFHPLNAEGAFTNDRTLGQHGIADVDDDDWRVRLLAIRDLVRLLPDAADDVSQGLFDKNLHVRQIAAAALGNARQTTSAGKLEQALQKDDSPVVRAQAAMSLGQMESAGSLDILKNLSKKDSSRDVRHQCALAIDQIEKIRGATDEQLAAIRNLNPEDFESVQLGGKALDFELNDTEGVPWRLSDANQNGWIVLIWIFADWCPVCHGEYRDLIDLRKEFKDAGVQLATIECHDTYRSRVMVGKELEPQYWFSKQSFKNKYRTGIWWPHLVDHAGAVGARYGVDPMSFAVHAEYVNRPSTIIIDPEGVVRFAYYGTFWGDRPTIHETLEMIENERFEYEHKDRRKSLPSR